MSAWFLSFKVFFFNASSLFGNVQNALTIVRLELTMQTDATDLCSNFREDSAGHHNVYLMLFIKIQIIKIVNLWRLILNQ